jgi:sec-independent protein translocase protein TatA
MGAMQPWHWLIVILVFVALFGAKKLPEMARSIGQSARVFKSEMKGMKDDDAARSEPAPPAQPSALPPSAPAAQQGTPQAAPQAQAGEGTPDSSR